MRFRGGEFSTGTMRNFQPELTQKAAARILKIAQPKISRLLRGQLSGFSTERLMQFLTLLGRDIEIVIKPVPRSRRQGHLYYGSPCSRGQFSASRPLTGIPSTGIQWISASEV